MSDIVEVKVPDIGDFKDVPVIEVLVKVGDAVKAEDSLITLESDKATMDVPSPVAGTVTESRSRSVTGLPRAAWSRWWSRRRRDGDRATSRRPGRCAGCRLPSQHRLRRRPAAGAFAGKADLECEMLVLGAGPGGYSAAFRAADLGMKTVIVERYATLGGVCLNVGCIPSKALLHVAAVMEEAEHASELGVSFAAPQVDIDILRAHKEKVVGKLTGGLAGMAKARKVETVRGYGHFLDANHLEVEETTGAAQDKTGAKKVIRFQKCIIAAGSAAFHLPFIPKDPRIVDSTGALELRQVPEEDAGHRRRHHRPGNGDGVFDAGCEGRCGRDARRPDAGPGSRPGQSLGKAEPATLRPGHAEDQDRCRGGQGRWPLGEVRRRTKHLPMHVRYDMILQSAGRAPNGKKIGAEKAGVIVSERGFIPVDSQMRTNVPHIFAIGDIVGNPMLAHKAVHEAHVAAEAAAGQKAHFDATVIPGVAYTHPEVAWVGVGEDEAKKAGRKVSVAKFPWAASGRAIANGADYGFTKLVFDEETHRVIGGSIVGPNAGDMIGEVALAIEMGADAVDIGKTIHPHPTLGETIGMAAEVAHGSCTDLPPMRKK